jgi:hypothetical protein
MSHQSKDEGKDRNQQPPSQRVGNQVHVSNSRLGCRHPNRPCSSSGDGKKNGKIWHDALRSGAVVQISGVYVPDEGTAIAF